MNAHHLKVTVDGNARAIQRFESRIAEYHRRCVGYAKTLQKTFRAETIHKLRTHLRRLQSYAELLEHEKAAERLAQAVSWFSQLRTLSEFHRYLRCMKGSPTDLRRVQKAAGKEQKRVHKADRPDAVEQLLATITTESLMRPAPFIMTRLEQSQIENRHKLHQSLQELPSKPNRKELHALRLLIKSLRYQQEILADIGWGNPRTVEALKRLQGTLGNYNDRHQFMKLAKKLDLGCRKAIKKDRRKARGCARRAVDKLTSTHMQPILPLRRP